MNRIKEIETRLAEIGVILSSDEENVNVEELTTEVNNLTEERAKLIKVKEERAKLLKNVQTGSVGTVLESNEGEARGMEENVRSTKEYRSAFFKNLRGIELNETEKRFTVATTEGASMPTETLDKLFTKMVKIAPMLNEIELLRVAGNVTFAVESVREVATKHQENKDITPSADKMIKVSLGGFEIVKLLKVSKTIQTMSIDAFETWLVGWLSEDVARAVEKTIVNGSGVGEGTGIATRTWVTSGEGQDRISIPSGTAIGYDDICKLIGLLPSAYDANAKMLMSKKTLFTHMATIKDANGRPILFSEMQEGLKYNIIGYPVVISDEVALGEVYLGDYKKYVGNLAEDINVQSDVSAGFASNSIMYRGTAIFDGKVAINEAIVSLKKVA